MWHTEESIKMGDDGDGAFAMRSAFEHFMLSGRKVNSSGEKKKRKKNKRQDSGGGSVNVSISDIIGPTAPSQHEKTPALLEQNEMQKRRHIQMQKKAERKYWQNFNAFRTTLERDWIGVDNNLEEVLESVNNTWSRLPKECRLLDALHEETREWVGYGYTQTGTGGLDPDDIRLALQHDLFQHEKMMRGIRTLLAALNESQDSLGRRVDELMLHHMQSVWLCNEMEPGVMGNGPSASFATTVSMVAYIQDLLSILSMELNRKQRLAREVLDIANDNLLCGTDDRYDLDGENYGLGEMVKSPRRVVTACCTNWPLGSKASFVDENLLNFVLQGGSEEM